jgi:phage baseplate assembly protein W
MDEEESIFPKADYDEEINDEAEEAEDEEQEHGGQVMKIDFASGDIVLEDGRPVLIDGAEALLQWIEKILTTQYGTYEIEYGYGANTKRILFAGNPKPYTRAELCRDIEETLEQHEEIESVDDFEFENEGINAVLAFTVTSVYGEIRKEVALHG